MLRATPNDRPAEPARRARNEVELVLGQRKLLQRLVPGLMHAFIFWGFIVLFPTIVAALVASVDRHAEIPFTWFGELVDVFVLLVLAGVVTAVVIRKVVRPRRFATANMASGIWICFFGFWLINMWVVWRGIETIRVLEGVGAPFLLIVGVALLWFTVSKAGGFGPVLGWSAAERCFKVP